MKYKFLHFVLLIFISYSACAEVIKTFSSDLEDDYFDTKTIEKVGDSIKVVSLRSFRKQQVSSRFTYFSKKHIYEFKCSAPTFKVLLTVAFELPLGKGKLIFKDDIPTPTFEPFDSGTEVDKIWRLSCGK